MGALITRLRREFEFARHIPLQQIARRAQLVTKRKIVDRFLSASPLEAWQGPGPKSLLRPRFFAPHGEVRRHKGRWRATFLNRSEDLGESVDWDALSNDPSSQLWAMNLHYFEYLEDVPQDDAIGLIEDWIRNCRPRTPLSSKASWTPYAISLRISAWLAWWSKNAHSATPEFRGLFAASVREQADYLYANVETDVCGNHLIKNVRALAEVGAVFQDRRSARWSRRAERLLRQEIPLQILQDGVHFERSPSYHTQVLVDLLAIRSVWGAERVQDLDSALEHMAQALTDLTHPDGYVAQFNDAGLNMAVKPSAALGAYAAQLGRSAPLARQFFALDDAGFYGARYDSDYLVAKFGPLGPNHLMAHAHGDWGSLEWSVGGQRVLVDQGVLKYSSGRARARSRSTAAHNTAQIGSSEQADFFGAFRCGARPHPAPASYRPAPEGFEIEGELIPAATPCAGTQVRRIVLAKRLLEIEDIAPAGASLEAHFLLHPSITARQDGSNVVLERSDGLRLSVTAEGGSLRVEPAHWWPDMGHEEETTRIVASAGGKRLTTTFRGD